jgi:hypothetical protein
LPPLLPAIYDYFQRHYAITMPPLLISADAAFAAIAHSQFLRLSIVFSLYFDICDTGGSFAAADATPFRYY